MPQIPFDPRVGSPGQAFGGEIRAEANPAALSQSGAALAQGGAQFSDAMQQFANFYTQAQRQKTAANLAYGGISALSEAQEKWARVPDVTTALSGFRDESQTIRDQTTSQTNDPEVQAEILRQLNQHAIFAENSVQQRSFQLEAAQQGATIDQHLDGLGQMAVTAPNDLARASLIDNAASQVRGAVAAGWMDAETGEHKLTNFRDQVWGSVLRRQLQADPVGAVAAYDAGQWNSRISGPELERMGPEIDEAKGQLLARSQLHLTGATPFGQGDGVASSGQPLSEAVAGGGVDPLIDEIIRGEGGSPQGVANNPGNIKFAGLPGQVDSGVHAQDGGTFASYASPAAGRQAIADLVTNAASGNSRAYGPSPTVAGFLRTYRGGGSMSSPAAVGAPADLESTVAAIDAAPGYSDRQKDIAVRVATGLHAVWQRAHAQDIASLKRSTDDGIAMLQDGRDWRPDEGAIRRLLPPDQADDLLRTADEARELGQAKNALQWAAPDEVTTLQARIAGMLNRDQDFARAERYSKQFAVALTERQNALKADPAAYAMQAPEVNAAWQRADALQQQGGDRAAAQAAMATQAAIAASLATQAHLGVQAQDQRVLTQPLASRLAHSIAGQDPAQIDMAAELDKLSKTYGRYWQQAFGDVVKAGLPREYQVLATMDGPGQLVAAGDFQRMLKTIGEKDGVKKLKESIAPEAAQTIDNTLPGTMQDFRLTMRNPATYSMMQGAVQNLANYYTYQGADPGTALQKAYDGIIGSHWDFDGALRVPKGQLATIETAGRAVIAGVHADQLRSPNWNRQLTLEQRQQAMQAALANGFWATNEGDDGAVLMLRYHGGGIDYARKLGGGRVEFKFADAPRLAAQAPAPPVPPYYSATPGTPP